MTFLEIEPLCLVVFSYYKNLKVWSSRVNQIIVFMEYIQIGHFLYFVFFIEFILSCMCHLEEENIDTIGFSDIFFLIFSYYYLIIKKRLKLFFTLLESTQDTVYIKDIY